MQYILTEQEYKELIPTKELVKTRNILLEGLERANDTILKLSNKHCEQTDGGSGYCDECPLNTITGTGTCTKSICYYKNHPNIHEDVIGVGEENTNEREA